MAFNLIITQEAHDDTDAIVGHMVSELKNLAAAGGFLDDVEETFRNLKRNPHVYALSSDARLSAAGIRKTVIKNYLILFRVDETSQTVFVLRIVYGGRNYADFM